MLRKHVNNTTVAIEVLRSFYVKEKRVWKLKVRWWNIGRCHPPYPLNIEQRIIVTADELNNWKPHSYQHEGTT